MLIAIGAAAVMVLVLGLVQARATSRTQEAELRRASEERARLRELRRARRAPP